MQILEFFINLLSGFSGVMIGILFLTVKSKNNRANLFLSIFIGSISINIIGKVFYNYNKIGNLIIPSFYLDTTLLIIPSLYLYIKMTLEGTFKISYLLLFIPGILSCVFSPFFFDIPFMGFFYSFFYLFINIPLLFLSFKILNKQKKISSNFYSDIEQKNLIWIKSILITVLIFHFIMFLGYAIFEVQEIRQILMFISSLILLFMVYWTGYNGFFQIELVESINFDKKNNSKETKNEPDNLKKENLSKIEIENFEKIKNKISNEKLFLDPNLNIKRLSKILNINERELSYLINTHTKNNFHHFINSYRIKEFKSALISKSAKVYSIVGLAKESGFSSKSGFYKTFKSFENITPKEFLKKHSTD